VCLSKQDHLSHSAMIWAGGVVHVVEHLPSKCQALSSKPSTAIKKKKVISRKYTLTSSILFVLFWFWFFFFFFCSTGV
jgi:hypothetical protein